MNDAEIKLQLIRIIDSQEGVVLLDWLNLLQSKIQKNSKNDLTELELGYKAMSEDIEREVHASEWIEGTLNIIRL